MWKVSLADWGKCVIKCVIAGVDAEVRRVYNHGTCMYGS
jgi:hypothetical protein